MRLQFRKPSPAMVVACISLFVALGGASYAAVTLPRNSVGTPQLKKNAVVSSKVKNRSLKALDFAAGQLPAGPQGPPGPTEAVVSVSGPTPLAAPPTVISPITITTTSPGKLLVGANLTALAPTSGPGVSCGGSGSCSVTFGIYVDGTPVPGTGQTINAAVSATTVLPAVILRGVLAGVLPGPHEVSLRLTTTGHALVIYFGRSELQAVAIG